MALLSFSRLCCLYGTFTLLLSGCGGTTTQLAPLPPGAVKAEEEKQRVLALQENERQQARLADLAYPILTMGAPLCPSDQGGHLGARLATIHNYESEWRPAAVKAFGLGDTLTILDVTYGAPAAMAGLKPGDRVAAVGNTMIPPGPRSIVDFTSALKTQKKAGAREVSIAVNRDGRPRRANVRLNEICDFGSMVVQSGELNAFADGEMIYVTSAMMRFLSNDELRVVIAHEFAHNAIGHIKAKKKSSLIDTGGYYTYQGAESGGTVFSQDFEREADYVGLYALTLADLPLEAAPSFWRHMAQAEPGSIGFAHTHPTTAERFVRMEQAIAEIRQKMTANLALRPNRKDMSRKTEAVEPVEPSLAVAKPKTNPAPAESGDPKPAAAPNPLTQAIEIDWSAAGSARSGAASARDQAEPSAVSRSSEAPDGVSGWPHVKSAMDDLIRLDMVTRYREVRPGLLHLMVGKGFTQQSAVEFQLALLHEAYEEVSGDPAIFELFREGKKIAHYGKDGLILSN